MDSSKSPLLETRVDGTICGTYHTVSGQRDSLDPDSRPLNENAHDSDSSRTEDSERGFAIKWILPLAFTSSFAITTISAAGVHAYAAITCRDPAHCDEEERKRFSATVAIATALANFCGIGTIWFLKAKAEAYPKIGLGLWFGCRALGISILALGGKLVCIPGATCKNASSQSFLTLVLRKSLAVAVIGRVFEGLASDNMLHYTLAAAYLRANSAAQFSKSMGISLGLYMSGAALGPTTMSFLPDFFFSFVLAVLVLGCSLVYLTVFVPSLSKSMPNIPNNSDISHGNGSQEFWKSHPAVILLALALFSYNCVESYLFPAIMIHTSSTLGFGVTENGYIITVAASVSALFLLATNYILPTFLKKQSSGSSAGESVSYKPLDDNAAHEASRLNRDLIYGAVSMLCLWVSVFGLLFIQTTWQMFCDAGLIAVGLAAPSFVKSYGVASVAATGGGSTARGYSLAVLAMMESLGALVSPIALGSVQANAGDSVFKVALCFIGFATVLLIPIAKLNRVGK